MVNLYPTSSGRLTIKENRDLLAGYDAKTKKWISLNKSLEDILLLSDGTHSVRDIINEVAKLYSNPIKEIEKRTIDVLASLEKDKIIDLKKSKQLVPIRFRKYDFEWPLQAAFIELTNRCNLNCALL